MSKQPLSITVERTIAATPEQVYALISDVTKMSLWSPETTSAEWVGGATSAIVGAKFKGRNAIGSVKWATTPTVTSADPGRRFAFKVPGAAGPIWSYDIEATPNGTVVRESMKQERRSPAPIRMLQRISGVRDREAHLRAAMVTTLDRLATAATAAGSAAA